MLIKFLKKKAVEGMVKEAIKQTVPTFYEPEDINKNATSTEYFKEQKISKTAE